MDLLSIISPNESQSKPFRNEIGKEITTLNKIIYAAPDIPMSFKISATELKTGEEIQSSSNYLRIQLPTTHTQHRFMQ